MIELRLIVIAPDELADGMKTVGQLPTGELVVDCCGEVPDVGKVVAQGRNRFDTLPPYLKRHVSRHLWAGE